MHIFDVSDPANPVWEASIDVERNVNDIVVRAGLAYLATGPGSTSPYTPLQIYDVAPSSPDYLDKIGSFGISIARAGTALYLLGSELYLGLERTTSGDDFYVLDIGDPATPQELGKASLGQNNSEVGDIVVQGDNAFIGMEGGNSQNVFQVWNVSDPAALWRRNVCVSGNPFPENSTGLVYRDDLIFASFRSNDPLKIIYDDADICVL